MNKHYIIYLDGKLIGITKLENVDVPMGIVFGRIESNENLIDYNFIKEYCQSNNIKLADDSPDDKLISTKTIKLFCVKNELGIEISGSGNQISGMDSDGFEISLEGILHSFYEEEFPHHVKAYKKMFKN